MFYPAMRYCNGFEGDEREMFQVERSKCRWRRERCSHERKGYLLNKTVRYGAVSMLPR